MYPSLLAHATEAKERLDCDDVRPAGGEPARGPAEAASAGGGSDRRDSVARPTGPARCPTPAADPARAFAVWSRTDLATYRLTSAVELYSADGRLVSRSGSACRNTPRPNIDRPGCSWDEPFDEVVAVRIQRAARAAHRPRRLRARPHGRQPRRARDARLSDAARSSRRRARIWSRCGRTGRSRPKACSGATSSSSSTGGAARRSSSRALRVWTLPDPRLPASRRVARAVLGHARSRRPDVPRLFPERPWRHLRARLSGDQLGSGT